MQLCRPSIIKYKYNANFNIYCFKFASHTLIKLKKKQVKVIVLPYLSKPGAVILKALGLAACVAHSSPEPFWKIHTSVHTPSPLFVSGSFHSSHSDRLLSPRNRLRPTLRPL